MIRKIRDFIIGFRFKKEILISIDDSLKELKTLNQLLLPRVVRIDEKLSILINKK